MRSPTQAIFWELWRGHRRVLLLLLFYFMLLSGLLPILHNTLPPSGFQGLPLALGVFLPVMAAILIAGAMTEVSLPTFTFTLPVSTRWLIAWHMLFAMGFVLLTWVTSAVLILWPWGVGDSSPHVGMAATAIGLLAVGIVAAALWWAIRPGRPRANFGWNVFYVLTTVMLTWNMVLLFFLDSPASNMELNLRQAALLVGFVGLEFAVATVLWQALVLSFFRLPALRIFIYAMILVHAAIIYFKVDYSFITFVIRPPANDIQLLVYVLTFALGLIAIAYLVAVAGTARRRRNEVDVAEWRWIAATIDFVLGLLPRRRGAFASPGRAQLWLEWRRFGYIFPAFIGFYMLVFLGLVFTLLSLKYSFGERASALVMVFGGYLWMVVLMAGGMGLDHGGVGYDPGKGAFSSFVATRPMTTNAWVLEKFKSAAVSTVIAWGLILLLANLWFAATGNFAEAAEAALWAPYGIFRMGWSLLMGDVDEAARCIILMSNSAEWLRWRMEFLEEYHTSLRNISLLTVAGLILITFKLLSENMFFRLAGSRLTGSNQFRVGSLAVCFALPILVIVLGRLAYWRPEYRDMFLAASPWLAAALVLLKFSFATWAMRALRRQGLADTQTLTRLLGGWVLIVLCLCALLPWLLPLELISLPWVAAGVVLFVPLARIAAAPLALAWNRHR